MAKILVIDDEQVIRKWMEHILAIEGYQVFSAENGESGIKIFEQERCEIAIVDIKMPGMDGIEVLERIKKITTDTDVIIVTGHGGIETAISALRKGAFDYLTKPIEYEEMALSIQRALERQKMRRDLAQHTKDLEEAHRQLKLQQAQLLQAAKLTAVGELGAGIAHEMNQPLMAISVHIESLLLNETVSGDKALMDKLAKIKDQFIRLGTIVKRVHEYSGSRGDSFADDDLNRPLKDAIYLFGQQLKDHNIETVMNTEKDAPHIYFDRYQIQDVVINFLVNARDAVNERFGGKEGGRIEITSKKLKCGKGMLVGVIDNGIPVKDGTESNIFDPFFTTKEPGKGTGLGLSVSYTIVKKHDGVIGFAPLKDGRKVFYFALPLSKGAHLYGDAEVAGELEHIKENI